MNIHIYYWVVIVLVVGYSFFVGYSVYSHGQLSGGLITAAHAYEQHPVHPTLRVLVVGDSGAVGVGSKNPADTIAGRIGADFPGADITNISVSGARVADLQSVLEGSSDAVHTHYDLLVIQIGANDVTHFTSDKNIRVRFDAILKHAEQISDHTIALMSGNVGAAPLFHFPLTTVFTIRTEQVRDIFVQEITSHPTVRYADLFKKGKANVLNTDIPRYYAADHFHPSGDGYGVWYQSVQPVLFDLIKN